MIYKVSYVVIGKPHPGEIVNMDSPPRVGDQVQLGDETFIRGLRQFYREQVFQTAGFSELQQAFEQVSGRDLSGFFDQWLQRKGAPALKLESFDLQPKPAGGYRLDLSLAQTQSGEPFALRIPLLIYLEDHPSARQITLESSVPALIPLSDLAAPPYGVRLRATAPVAATAIALGRGRIKYTI